MRAVVLDADALRIDLSPQALSTAAQPAGASAGEGAGTEAGAGAVVGANSAGFRRRRLSVVTDTVVRGMQRRLSLGSPSKLDARASPPEPPRSAHDGASVATPTRGAVTGAEPTTLLLTFPSAERAFELHQLLEAGRQAHAPAAWR